LRRFNLEAQDNHFPSFAAGFPKLLKAAPPACGKGARSWHWAVLPRAAETLHISSPSPAHLGQPPGVSLMACDLFFQKHHLRLSFQRMEIPDSFSFVPIF